MFGISNDDVLKRGTAFIPLLLGKIGLANEVPANQIGRALFQNSFTSLTSRRAIAPQQGAADEGVNFFESYRMIVQPELSHRIGSANGLDARNQRVREPKTGERAGQG